MEAQFYLAQDVQKALGIGRGTTYQFLNEVYKKQSPFKVVKMGKLIRIPKASFDKWIEDLNK